MKILHVKKIILFIVFSTLGCQAESRKTSLGDNCRPYIDLYLSFHEAMINEKSSDKGAVLLRSLHIHPEDTKNQESLMTLVSAYIEHETDIKEIDEYYVSCDSNKRYASAWFKIIDSNPHYNRLYVVITEGKIATLSKEIAASANKIDNGKKYLKINKTSLD